MIDFKTPRLRQEFNELAVHNPKLKSILLLLDQFTNLAFARSVTVTELYRTPQENAALYAATGKEPEWKPHTMWLAADIRARDFSPEQRSIIASFLNNIRVFGGQRKCAVFHEITGNVIHGHLQSDRGDLT